MLQVLWDPKIYLNHRVCCELHVKSFCEETNALAPLLVLDHGFLIWLIIRPVIHNTCLDV